MKTHFLTTAMALSDRDLLTRVDALAAAERGATAELVAHLAALELRPTLYLARGYGSLFDYCTQALRMSEDTACNRIQITRVCRRFPTILDRLAAGSATLSSIRMLGPHLTEENHEGVLARAANRRRGDIEALVAELAPKPDVVASVRKVPVRNGPAAASIPPFPPRAAAAGTEGTLDFAFSSRTEAVLDTIGGAGTAGTEPRGPSAAVGPSGAAPHTARPIIRTSAPNRYRVQFTIGQESHDKLRRLQGLLRREIPSGDPGVLFERMLDLYLDKIEKAKMGGTSSPKRRGARPTPRLQVGQGTQPEAGSAAERPLAAPSDRACGNSIRRAADTRSRHIPTAVKRAVWFRDAGQCAFVSAEGRRCAERAFLELHHIHPYALSGPATAGNISLRCRRHNQYEAELVFGSRTAMVARPG